ncbi:putative FAM18-like protein-related protein [Trichomonas vaginalis G3]|uniref:Golgi apparatus membrane protein TVP23 homolog n=1 Tax=Trichomonas vaginalis (strain ATCC PRA-98 / G3) TaxID=412133 RepID=A2EUF9_TRIV3|nr:uncharacterized protein TVAGG3_0317100 [Trichomonas vaginalis G3]EAY03718.1 putative FAM18-like protein-related protein [Trichomonas vaginalis G3]KAI5529018.1 Golgi APPARATUS membrane protein TVP23 family [Trichomonas vaginalis G3]|eukprot:XP_001315941.1 hypothetical protein [Trichomonas vaginalis G3]
MENVETLSYETSNSFWTNKFLSMMFIVCKLFSIILFLFLLSRRNKSTLGFLAYISALAIDFLNTKNVGGPQLIGLGWYIETDFESGSLIQSLSKPPPFVPNPTDSNLFWLVSILSFAIWIVNALLAVGLGSFFHFFLAVIGIITDALNLFLFIHAHNLLRVENMKLVRSALESELEPLNLADHNKNPNQKQEK